MDGDKQCNYYLLEVKMKEKGKALKKQFLLIFPSTMQGILTDEKTTTNFFSVLKSLVAMISDISWSFNLSERYHHFWKHTVFYFFFSCRLLVEKIFAQYLVPHNLETEERMKCLYYLYASLDPNAVK